MRFLQKRWGRRLVVYGSLYFVGAIVLMGCADRLILFPSRDPVAIAGQTARMVQGPAGAIQIWTQRSAAARNAEPQAFVLQFVGNASRGEYEADDAATQWSELPVEVWGVNYPGIGSSEGRATLKSIAPAALAAFDAIKGRAAGRPIFVSANSIGTTAALYVAAHRPVAGLVLKNPPPLRQLVLGHYGWWNLWLAAGPFVLQIPSDLDSINNAKQIHSPAVFLLANNDTTVPPKFQQKVVDAFAGPKHLIRMSNSGHNSMIEGTPLTQLRAEIQWLWTAQAAPIR